MDPIRLTTCTRLPIKKNSARKLLKKQFLSKVQRQEVVSSFDGQIDASHGRSGEQLIITESATGEASGVFV